MFSTPKGALHNIAGNTCTAKTLQTSLRRSPKLQDGNVTCRIDTRPTNYHHDRNVSLCRGSEIDYHNTRMTTPSKPSEPHSMGTDYIKLIATTEGSPVLKSASVLSPRITRGINKGVKAKSGLHINKSKII